MKLFGYKIFPKKFKVRVFLKSGNIFFFYCDKYEFTLTGGFSYSGALTKYGSQLPKSNIFVDPESIEAVSHKKIRLFRIYK
jgi:hypothetical protein